METKGVTCKIPLDLHNQISEEIRETESTMSKFIEMIIREHYEKGANRIMEKGRTLAFQVSEELFQRVKEYLENYEKAYHRRLTQKEFVIGLIEQALEEAEEEFEAARAAEHEEQAENGWEAAEIAESDEDEEVSDDEEPEDWDEENGETEGLSADEETTGSSWEPAENTETGEGEEEPSEDDEDTTPESWNQDEEEETEPDDDTLAYAIGAAQPVMVEVDTFKTGTVCADDCLADAVKLVFGLTPAEIIAKLDLLSPRYTGTAAYGHFGRPEFPWERTDQAKILRAAVI